MEKAWVDMIFSYGMDRWVSRWIDGWIRLVDDWIGLVDAWVDEMLN